MADANHTYDETLSTTLSKVRFRLQDVRAPWIFTDAEINYVIGDTTSTSAALVVLARTGLVRATNRARTYSNEQGSEDLVSRVALFQELIREFEKENADSLPRVTFTHLGSTPSDLDYNT